MKLVCSIPALLAVVLGAVACTPSGAALRPAQVVVSVPTSASPSPPPVPPERPPIGTAACDCRDPFAASPPPGIAQPPLIICSCPFLPVPPSQTPSNPGALLPGAVVTLADNGGIFVMRPGAHFLLELGTEVFQWSVAVDNPAVLSRIPSLVIIRGTQGVYQAHQPGQATLTAVGAPLCRNSRPMCMAPSIVFRLTVIVR